MPITAKTFLSQINFVNSSSINNITTDEAADILKLELMLLDTDGYTRALVQEGLVHVKRDSGSDKLEVVVSNGVDSQYSKNFPTAFSSAPTSNGPFDRYTTPSRAYRMPILRGQQSDHQKSVRLSVAFDTLYERGTIFSV